jgi:hypothetical protein
MVWFGRLRLLTDKYWERDGFLKTSFHISAVYPESNKQSSNRNAFSHRVSAILASFVYGLPNYTDQLKN